MTRTEKRELITRFRQLADSEGEAYKELGWQLYENNDTVKSFLSHHIARCFYSFRVLKENNFIDSNINIEAVLDFLIEKPMTDNYYFYKSALYKFSELFQKSLESEAWD